MLMKRHKIITSFVVTKLYFGELNRYSSVQKVVGYIHSRKGVG